MPTEINRRLTMDELEATREFALLSPKMASFVRAYVHHFTDTGVLDACAATKASDYDCASDETARTFGYQLLVNPKIECVLNLFLGNSPEQAFLKQVEWVMSKSKPNGAKIKAMQLYSDLRGWSNNLRSLTIPEPDADETTPAAKSEPQIPKGATALRDADGVLKGYRTPEGEYVQLPIPVEAVR